jgi:2-C-methyl-D-erythritol 4-phosphate cytidylyltransferase
MHLPKRYAIIVAGGSGSRMQSSVPKQFLLVGGKPVLMHVLEKFYRPQTIIIVVLPQAEIQYWKQLTETHKCVIPHQVVSGGETRHQSVKNGMAVLPQEDGLVAIHDGARMFVSQALIEEMYRNAAVHGAAIPVIPVSDSLRQLRGHASVSVNRDEFFIVQTPQVFNVAVLKNAFANALQSHYADEASLVEEMGAHIQLVPGEQTNLKITFPTDIRWAEAMLAGEKFSGMH